MNLYLRLFYTIFISFWRGRAPLEQELVLSFRTWPHDLDINLHMNNGRYLTLMDLGRLQMMIRSGLVSHIVKKRWMPVIGGAEVTFRRSLKPFQAFTLHTKLLRSDEKWIYFEHRFESGGELITRAEVRGLIRDGKRNVPSAEVLGLVGG